MNEKFYPLKGGYEKICPKCGIKFYGRKNKKYCLPKCKNAYGNDNNEMYRNMAKTELLAINKNIRILEKLYNKYGKNPFLLDELYEEGFKKKCPVIIIYKKDYIERWLGVFCFIITGNKITIEKHARIL